MLVPTEIEGLDPRFASDALALRASRLVHAGLARLDPDTLVPVPYVARSWRWAGELALVVELRDDVRFRSGKPVDADDVAATIRGFAGSRHAQVVEPVAGVDDLGARRVRIRLKRPYATLLSALEVPVLRADEADGPPRLDGSLDGLGPFETARFARGEVRFAPRDHGALPRPAHEVVFRSVRDENARALRLFAGRADLIQNGLSPVVLPAVARQPGVAVTARSGANLTYMVFRTDRGPFADARVRRAVAAGIDRPRIARTLLGGHAGVADSIFPPGHWARTPAEGRPFDPARTREELARAGVTNLRFTLTTSTDRLRGTIARFIGQTLADSGVTVEVVPLELGTMLARLGSGDFEAATLQLPELGEPNVLRVFLHSASIPPNGSNRGRVRDAELDRLLDEGMRELDVDARRGIYARVDARVREELWIVPLFHEDQIAVTSERARGYVPSAEGRYLGLAALK